MVGPESPLPERSGARARLRGEIVVAATDRELPEVVQVGRERRAVRAEDLLEDRDGAAVLGARFFRPPLEEEDVAEIGDRPRDGVVVFAERRLPDRQALVDRDPRASSYLSSRTSRRPSSRASSPLMNGSLERSVSASASAAQSCASAKRAWRSPTSTTNALSERAAWASWRPASAAAKERRNVRSDVG